jgi:predicted transcriptional regulator
MKSFELDAATEAELLLSLAEADRGELIPAEDVLRTFRDLD